MYRHFPSRRELVIAVYDGEVTALSELGRSLPAGSSPADALFIWLRAFITHIATKRDLPLAIPDDTTGQRSALYRQWHGTMRTTASGLLARAQEAGTIRNDLDVADLLAAASGIGHAAADDSQANRLLASSATASRHRPARLPHPTTSINHRSASSRRPRRGRQQPSAASAARSAPGGQKPASSAPDSAPDLQATAMICG